MAYSFLSETQRISILQKVEKITDNTGSIGIYGASFGISVIILSCILHLFQVPMNPFSHWVSNLGADPTWGQFIFNRGLQITAVLLALFLAGVTNTIRPYLIRYKWILHIASLTGIIASAGIIILTKWNMFAEPELHMLGAMMFFIGALLFMSLYTLALNWAKLSSPAQNRITYGVLFIYALMIPMTWISLTYLTTGIKLSQALSNMDAGLGGVRIMEWCILTIFFTWLIQTGIRMRKIRKNL